MIITLHPATAADAESLVAIQQKAFRRMYEIYRDEGSPYLRGADEILRWLERPNCKVFKIFADGVLVGGIAAWERNGLPGEYYLARIYILPEMQNKGIASQAILLCETEFPNASRWTLDFPFDESANRRCYEKAGYVDTGERRGQSGGVITLAYMEKKITLNTEKFTGKAQAYAKARPGYPDEAVEYVCSLVPPNAVFADVGAGTGKLTEMLAARGYSVFAVEPNVDMRGQLAVTLAPYPNAKIVDGSAEATTLTDQSVDVITCAQALHWFDLDVFRTECRRIGKPRCLVIAIYNNTPGGSSIKHSKQSTDVFYTNPTIREFLNPMRYSRDNWLAYMTSHSHDPLPSDPGYASHIAKMDAIFDRENTDGLIRRDVVTMIYSEVFNSEHQSINLHK